MFKTWLTQLKRCLTVSTIVAYGLLTLVPAPVLRAASTNTARISFTFDDGYASTLLQAAPTLAQYGLTGVSYITTGCVGMTTAPNTCRADTSAQYMTWAQIAQLKSTYGWEIGSHTVTHPCLASNTKPECQRRVLTPAQVTTELSQSKADLAAHGINATAFSSPYGDYNPAVQAQIAKYYSSHRGFADRNNNTWPYNDYVLNNFPVQVGVSVAQVKAKIDEAVAGRQWLILTLHDIKPNPSTDPDDYQYATANLAQIAAYVAQKQATGSLDDVSVSQGLAMGQTNLMPNSTFNSGLSGGWSTDGPATITNNTATNGSYPDPANAVRFLSAGTTKHLFSPRVPVSSTNAYLLKNYLSVQKLSSGEIAFYIDEYDQSGDWLSGQFKAAENSVYVESLNFTYQPSSAGVTSARLQVIVTAGSGLTAYLDNVQWYALTNNPAPASAPNLLTNGSFEAGLSSGWSTDAPSHVLADSANHGTVPEPVHSIKLSSRATNNSHLFSPLVNVSSAKIYRLGGYLNLISKASDNAASEIGFYVDEYDASGNWVSGRYLSGVRTLGAQLLALDYQPSSGAVASARLQVIVTFGNATLAYFDQAYWQEK